MNKKGLVFYYDWLDQLSVLSDSDFRQVIAAIILYHKSQLPPEPISPLADMALGFIIPQIERMKERGANGKLGGRPRKYQDDTPPSNSTFDTDEFFSAALEKSKRNSQLRREMQNAECKMQN